jgi:arylsulfatase A-like enzyme
MFVFYFDPHHDYIPPKPFDTMFDPDYDGSIDGCGITDAPLKNNRPPQRDLDHIVALYDGEIRYTDTYISKLLDAFAKFDILDRTLVVIFGDHGDEFYEHGGTGHARTLYNEIIHVPLVFRWPSEIPKGRCFDALVSQVDIMPTIFDYLGIQHKLAMQGASLKKLIEGRVSWINEYVFAGGSNGKCAIIGIRNKMLLNHAIGGTEFYDLSNDPREQNNIYQGLDSSSLTAAFERQLKGWSLKNKEFTARFPRDSHSDRIRLDEHRLKQLRALGYVQ